MDVVKQRRRVVGLVFMPRHFIDYQFMSLLAAGFADGEKRHEHTYGIIHGDSYGMTIMRPTKRVRVYLASHRLSHPSPNINRDIRL